MDDDQPKIDGLLRIIDQAYWMIEVGDRIGAMKTLSQYAKPRDQKDHWLKTKGGNNEV